jgi:hypothetical protein
MSEEEHGASSGFRAVEREGFEQTMEAMRRIKENEFRTKLAIVGIFGWLLGVIMVCAWLGVKPLW